MLKNNPELYGYNLFCCFDKLSCAFFPPVFHCQGLKTLIFERKVLFGLENEVLNYLFRVSMFKTSQDTTGHAVTRFFDFRAKKNVSEKKLLHPSRIMFVVRVSLITQS